MSVQGYMMRLFPPRGHADAPGHEFSEAAPGPMIPVWIAIDRYRDRRGARLAQARWQAWEATHPREPPDDLARRAQIRQQLWLEHMPAHVQAYLLRERLADAEREAQVQAILEAERRGDADGR